MQNSALYLYVRSWPIVHGVGVVHAGMSLSKDQSRAYCVRSSVHLAMASTVEAQTPEQAKSLSKTESCDRKPVIDLEMPAGILQLTEISTSFNV